MSYDWKSLLKSSIFRFSRKGDKYITYGTAGFRTKAEDLTHVLFRMGLLGSLRSKVLNSQSIGLMITASHNPEPDNGVKLVDPKGEMLELKWETIATQIANCQDKDLETVIQDICQQFNIDVATNSKLVIGRDTRPSSDLLRDAAVEGAKVLNTQVIDHGVISTPMLHYFVVLHNNGVEQPTPQHYYEKLSKPFNQIKKCFKADSNYSGVLSFDGANGVGAIAMKNLEKYISDSLSLHLYNTSTGSKGKLNYMCGADYVKTKVRLPDGIEVVKGRRCCSVDGDADRLVYYYVDALSNFHLLDGDRIATLYAGYIGELVKECNLNLKLGLIQTAYANGSSTKYIAEKLKIDVACTATGVKHLHAKAHEYDIGVYFEANGHGTILFSEKAHQDIQNAAKKNHLEGQEFGPGVKLLALLEMTNETVGDALSDLLLVETVLGLKGWCATDWLHTYEDLPNKLSVVKVKDRNAIVTKNAQGECSKPEGLQEAINNLVSKYPLARAFVRASGTEDVIRVYAEAKDKDDCEMLSSEVSLAVYNMAEGVGDPPQLYDPAAKY